jgi:predicted RNA-binding Zn ribbon-like protein
MIKASPQPPPVRYIAGDTALDLINTVDWTSDGLVDERLVSFTALLRWSEGAGLLSAAVARRLAAVAARHPRAAARVLEDVRRLRRATRRLVLARLGMPVRSDTLTADAALRTVSAFGRAAAGHRQLGMAAGRRPEAGVVAIDWTWTGLDAREPPLRLVLWMATHAASRLVSNERVDRWRVCPSAACGWVFIDGTRNGRRRWCEMATCGTRAKDRRRRGPARAHPAQGADR